ncbi:MAG: tetratricopeptide repeat protein, partial [Treponema sp.]|nr:tetratricopeptide repeat protein [Treponema sp.]
SISASKRRLAETFAAMGKNAPALSRLKEIWDIPGYRRGSAELLLAARLAAALELYVEAEEYIDVCLSLEPSLSPAMTEKAKLLYARQRYEELRDYAAEALESDSSNATIRVLLGHAHWELREHEQAAGAYDKALEMLRLSSEHDGMIGLIAANAANVYEVLGRKTEALDRYVEAGRAYLGADNYRDLGTMMPKLLALGPDLWEAHALAGKWAFGIEDWETAGREFDTAEKLRMAMESEAKDPPARDPALVFLKGLLLIREGKRREALPLLEEAAALAPDYGLFYFRLAENRYLLSSDAADPRLQIDLDKALSLLKPGAPQDKTPNIDRGPWGWVNNLAAQISLARGDLDAAAGFLEQAAAVLGETPPVLVNRGVYHYLRGSLDEALALLDTDKSVDAEGLMANCAGNLLVRSGQCDRADAFYQKALAIAPDNPEFMGNRASCLIELGAYGEAEALLARLHSHAPSPMALELIAYVAVKKGEYPRAESACKAALEMDANHAPSLYSLGWIYSSGGRWAEAGEALARLDALSLSGEYAERREELRQRILDGTTRLIPCAACDRTWRIPRDPPPVASLRIMAMPPDDLPAGSCSSCGTSYCIGCAKEHLDDQGRFVCPSCGKTLKLMNEGLKKLVADWAEKELP